jgi:hypothetical protein
MMLMQMVQSKYQHAHTYRSKNTQRKRFAKTEVLNSMNIYTGTVFSIDSKHRQMVEHMEVRSVACSGWLLALNGGGSPLL